MRQEGLIGKIRSERSEPVILSWDKEEEPVQHVKPASPIQAIESYPHVELAPDVEAIDSHSHGDAEITQTQSVIGIILDLNFSLRLFQNVTLN